MLRYVKYLRKAQGVIRRLNTVDNHVEASAGRLSLQLHKVPQLAKGYATRASTKPSQSLQGYDKLFQNLESQLRKSGRVLKPDIERILGEIALSGNIQSLEGLLLVRCCGKPLIDRTSSESIELVQEVWNTLEKLNVPIDVSHYNTLLNVYLEKNHKFSPDKFMETMKAKNIELNRVTYQRLIAGYCQSGDIDGATKILSIMHEKSIPVCENIFNSLITGHSESNDMESAVGILKTMQEAGIQHSADTYSALLSAYAKRGDINSINETQEKMKNLEITLQDSHIMDIIICLAENGHIDQALDFSKKLTKEISSDVEAGRLIVKLVDIKQHNLAIEILKNTSSDSKRHQIRSRFLIRSLINDKNYTNNEVIDVCRVLEDENLNNQAFFFALYVVLSNNSAHNRAIELIKAWSARGSEIREHYFWPLICEYTRQSNIDGMNNVLKIMIDDFKIIPSIDTLKEYVIPYMFGTYENIIGQLRLLNIPKDHVILAVASRLIYEKKLRNAAMFMTSYPCKYSTDQFLKPMAESLNYRDDTKSFVVILRFLTNDSNTETLDTDNTSTEIVDAAVKECLSSVTIQKSKTIAKLINELVESGLSMSSSVADAVRSSFGQELTPEIDAAINKLASGELKPVPMTEYNPYLNAKLSTNNNDNQRGRYEMVDLRRQFAYNIEKKNDNAIYDILKKMETAGYSSAAVYAQAIDMFCEAGNIDAATEFVNKFDEKYKNEKLDHLKVLKYATLLVKKDRFTEALQFISEKPVPEGTKERKSRTLSANVRRLLDAVVDTKNVENLEQLFNFLKTKNYIDIDNYVLGPLVKIHIERNDLPKALDTFERSCIEYKCTPYKNVLSMSFIETEDANSLQKLTDLCTEIHGESNALVDLAFIFLECGRVKQAKKILETTGVQMFNDKLINVIQKFAKNNKHECLEQITKITRNVVRLDRGLLYNTLLDVHINNNDWQKGLALWTEMQEDDVQPTSYFLNQLGNLLTKNNQQIPFIISSEKTSIIYDKKPLSFDKNNDDNRSMRRSQLDVHLTDAIARKDWAQAEDICRNPPNSRREIRSKFGHLIRALINNNELDRAITLTRSVIQQEYNIRPYLFTELCDKLIEEKRFDDIEKFGEILNEDLSDELDYPKVMSKVHIMNNGVLDFIKNVKINITDDDVRSVERNIHFGELTHGLLRDPSSLQEYELWAKNLADKGVTRGMQVLWNFNFINKSPKADDLWTEYIVKNKSPLIRPIIDVGLSTKDPGLIKKLIQKLEEHPQLNINSKCRALSGLILTYTSMGQIDDALNVLGDVTKRYRIELLSRNVLRQLKNKVEQSGKIFPYALDRQAYDSVDEPEQRSATM